MRKITPRAPTRSLHKSRPPEPCWWTPVIVAGRRFRFVKWTLRPDAEVDAPRTAHRFRCVTLDDHDDECGACSGACADPGEAQGWAFGRWRANLDHTSFAETVERPWVMWMGGPA